MRIGQDSVRASRESQRAAKITKNVCVIKTQLLTITNKSRSQLSHYPFLDTVRPWPPSMATISAHVTVNILGSFAMWVQTPHGLSECDQF